jgi:diguanylate cyclase (GGDEF)-like protein
MAVSIRNLKIRQQVLLVTLPPILALVVTISLSFLIYWMAQTIESHTRNAEDSVAEEQFLLRRLAEMYLDARIYLGTGRQPMLTAFRAAERDFTQGIENLKGLERENPDHVAAANKIESDMRAWEAAWVTPNFNRVQQGQTIQDTTVLDEGETSMAPFRGGLERLIQEDENASRQTALISQRMLNRILGLGVVVALFLAGTLIFLTRLVTRLISEPVRQLIEASERVGRGDYQPVLPPPVENEFGLLSESFSRMTAALRLEKEEMAVLNRFFEAVGQCTSEAEIHQHILHSLQERFRPRQIIIFQLNTVEKYLEAVATLEPLPENLRAWPVIDEPHDCKAVRMGRHFVVNDVTREPLCPARFAPPSEGSYYCSPLIAGGIIIGAVRMEGSVGLWTREREGLAESYLSGAASALSNLRLLEKMKQQANVDELTGLYNRRFLEDYARKQVAMASRKETPLGVIMLDLDKFKDFNDHFGHEVGDRILREFAKTVIHAMRETNLAARYGGEEFVVLLPDTDLASCQLVAERIRKAVEKMVVPSGTEKPLPGITVSLGIAVYPDHGKTFEEVVNASDKALYDSKRAGRNRVSIYMVQPEAAF